VLAWLTCHLVKSGAGVDRCQARIIINGVVGFDRRREWSVGANETMSVEVITAIVVPAGIVTLEYQLGAVSGSFIISSQFGSCGVIAQNIVDFGPVDASLEVT
jgi:hypothetical protein